MRNEIILQELNRVKAEILKSKTNETLIFPLFSDLHTNGIQDELNEFFIECLSEICKAIFPNAVINLGDNFTMLGREKHIPNDLLKDEFSKLFCEIKKKINCPLFLINGNHDAIGTDFFKSDFWYDIVNGKYDNDLAHRSEGNGYYYVDFDSAEIRLIFLSIPSDSYLYAENPTPIWEFGKNQLKWFKDIALNTNHKILLFSHVPFFYKYRGNMETKIEVWNGKETAFSFVSNLCGWIDDAKEAVDMIKENDNIIACFSGHTHKDSLFKPLEKIGLDENILPCAQVVTKNSIPFPWDDNKGFFGISIDIIMYKPSERVIDIIRFGDGEDRKINI